MIEARTRRRAPARPCIRPAALAGLALCALLAAQTARAADLEVTILGVERAEGSVLVALYASQQAFTERDPARGVKVEARPGPLRVAIPDVAPGTYSVSVFHDLDDDGVLGKSWVGTPSEPYGFSRNARGRFGPPKFDEMAIRLGDDDARVEIEIR